MDFFGVGSLGHYCTREEAARMLKVSQVRVSQLMGSGRLGYIVVGRRRFPSRQAVIALRAWRDRVQIEHEERISNGV
jgi:hypothetical protein